MVRKHNACYDFLYLIFCGVRERKTAPKIPDSQKVKIRVGFDGKDTLMDPTNINIKALFGNFAVLLDSNNQVVPLNSEGFVVGDPLDPRKKYTVVVNTHGSSKTKWDDMLHNGGGKHPHSPKHHHSHHSSKKKNKKKSHSSKKDHGHGGGSHGSSGGITEEMKLISANGSGDDDFSTKEFAVSTTQYLLTASDDLQ